ncbi:MAG: nuclear transport factor 2 family protein [Novosphingobium sp.]|nr:nuclear transport factor 2 family protein [Novosphingobium sp.]
MPADADLMPAEVRELLDRQQITQALYTYCRAVDRVDRELGYTIWNEGATVDYGDTIFIGDARGLIDWICTSHEQGVAHSHQIANIIVTFNGEQAYSEAYINSAMRMMHEGQLMQVNTRGRYLDRWSRQNGRWGIDRREFVCDFDEVHPAVPGSIPPRLTLDRKDRSYVLFAGEL